MAYVVTSVDPMDLSLIDDDAVVIALQSVHAVINTRKGSVPMNRDYGLSQEFLDQPLNVAMPMIVADVKESVEDNVPGVEVSDVIVEYTDDGRLSVSVEVEVLEEDDEQSE